jgi:hypothetical protein
MAPVRLVSCLAAAAMITISAVRSWGGEAEINSARSTITNQLDAFLADDGALAYSYAAPNIKSMYPTVGSFMKMVTEGYRPVRRPQSYAFGRSTELGPGSVVQEVLVVGPDGKSYSAIYTLQLQPDGIFWISGVTLQPGRPPTT